jgi:ribonuclease HII
MTSSEEKKSDLLRLECSLRTDAIRHIAGVDEAGRGPLAGPVVAAAVIFPSDCYLPGVDDSKKLTSANRDELFARIMESALSVGVGVVSHQIIDEINILNATFRAMHEAIGKLTVTPDHLLVDGNMFPGGNLPFTTVIGGDGRCFSIAAASIVAKVTRDRIMREYDEQFPGYGFAIHKGYGTREHRKAIARLGHCAIHRRSFHLKTSAETEHVNEKEDVCSGISNGMEEETTRKKGTSEKP